MGTWSYAKWALTRADLRTQCSPACCVIQSAPFTEMASDSSSRTARSQHGGGGQVLKLFVQNVRGDLNLLSNEAKKKYPAVREVHS